MHSFSGSRRLRLPDPENERKVVNYSPKDTASHPQRLEPSRTPWLCVSTGHEMEEG